MLELDIKFNNFLSKHYDLIDLNEKENFKNILTLSDQIIYGYLFSNIKCPKEYKHIIKLLKAS